jgi:beta-lactam-binding protein with PASTA domain
VPDVAGKTIEEAQKLLEDAGFGFANGGAGDSALPAGQAASTNPSGTVPKGSIVTVYTSNGLLATVPDVSGAASYDEAKAALQSAGFANVGQKCAVDPAATTPKVTGVDPPAGTAARKDGKVTVTVSKTSC